jgi:DNA-binding XRE family transcriptional regulator
MTETKDSPNPIWDARKNVLLLSQTEMGRRIGVSRSTIYLWESDEERIPKWAVKFITVLVGIERLTDALRTAHLQEIR